MREDEGGVGYSLDKPVAAAAAIVVFLELDKLQLAERLKHIVQVLLGDAEMNVTDIEAVEGDRIRVVTGRLRVADLAVLLSLGQLDDDGDT